MKLFAFPFLLGIPLTVSTALAQELPSEEEPQTESIDSDAAGSDEAAELPSEPAEASSDAAPAQPEESAPRAEKEDFDGARFRWGLSGLGGPLMGGYSGGAGGVDARFGVQLSETLGIYAQPMFLLGAGASADTSGASASAIAVWGVGALAEATLLDMIYVGLGPELVSGALGSASASTSGASAEGSSGQFFSVASRIGVVLGKTTPARRQGLSIGLDLRVILAGRTAVLPMVALGYDAF